MRYTRMVDARWVHFIYLFSRNNGARGVRAYAIN